MADYCKKLSGETSFARAANSPSILSISAWFLSMNEASSSRDISESAFCAGGSLRVGAICPARSRILIDRSARTRALTASS